MDIEQYTHVGLFTTYSAYRKIISKMKQSAESQQSRWWLFSRDYATCEIRYSSPVEPCGITNTNDKCYMQQTETHPCSCLVCRL